MGSQQVWSVRLIDNALVGKQRQLGELEPADLIRLHGSSGAEVDDGAIRYQRALGIHHAPRQHLPGSVEHCRPEVDLPALRQCHCLRPLALRDEASVLAIHIGGEFDTVWQPRKAEAPLGISRCGR